MNVLIEVNMGGEISKGGVEPEKVIEFIESLNEFKRLNVQGLMSVLPNLDDKVELSAHYKKLYSLYEETKRAFPKKEIKFLSAGMSGDYEIALECGANMIRLGSCLFGRRNYN